VTQPELNQEQKPAIKRTAFVLMNPLKTMTLEFIEKYKGIKKIKTRQNILHFSLLQFQFFSLLPLSLRKI
jgi:hypothetical protein